MFVILEPGLEVTGAALATMLSNIIALIYFAIQFFRLRKTTVLSVSPRYLPRGLRFTGQVLSVGLPSAIGTLLASLSNITINNLASGYGDIPVAAFGIVKKIDMLPMNIGMGLAQGMMPLVAYNYASGDYKRMKDVARCARIADIGCAAVSIALFEPFAPYIVRLFISEPETLALGTVFLRICCLATPVMICNFLFSYTFQAMGKGAESLLLTSCRQGLINIPLLLLMNHLFGLFGVVWTQLLADSITVVISFALYRRVHRQLEALSLPLCFSAAAADPGPPYKSRLPFSIQSLIPTCGSGLMIQKTVGFFPAAFLLQARYPAPSPRRTDTKSPLPGLAEG